MSSLARRAVLIVLPALVGGVAYAAHGRIAIAGAWGTGYAGLLARHGMPRERLLDPQLADPAILRRHDAVVVTGTVSNWDAAQPIVEQYVREGGCALLEYSALPSTEALPGERIGGQAGPNFVLEAAGHPALAGLPAGKTYSHNGNPAAAIVPDPAAGAVVLARFTEEGAGDKIRGKFVLNGQSVPAILYRPLGQGHLVYSGPWMGDVMAFGGDHSDLILALLGFLTQGNVVPRLTLAGPGNLLTTAVWGAQPETAETPATEPTLPDGYTLVEGPAPTFQEYDVIGRVAGPVELLLDYAAADRGYHLRLEDGKPLVLAPSDADAASPARAAVSAPQGAEVVVARRRGTIAVAIDGRRVCETVDAGQWPGAVACQGLSEPTVQPVEPVSFTDDFMQEAGQAAGWQRVAGEWHIVSTEGEPRTGANPFSYGVDTGEVAIATAGEWFWDDYAFEASARWTQNAVGLICNYRDADNYQCAEADLAAQSLRLVTVRGGKRAESKPLSVALRPWQWYRLGVRTSRGLIVLSLDGTPLAEFREAGGGLGPIGLYARGAKAAFDDVTVTEWRAGPSLRDTGSWRWEIGAPPVGEDGRIVVRGAARTAESWRDVAVTAEVRLGDAPQAGVRVRDTGDAGCAAVIERTASGLALKLVQTVGDKATTLGSLPLNGRKSTDPLKLTVKAVRERVFCAVGDGPYLLRAASLPAEGAVGVFTSGQGGAQFSGLDIRPADSGLHPADPPTPAYAGAVDVMTWAGAAFSWAPDPADLDLFWHEGEVPGPLRLRVGVHQGAAKEAVAEVHLAESGGAGGSGYVARFAHTWGDAEVNVSLLLAGKALAQGVYHGSPLEAGYLAEVEGSGPTLALRVNGTPVLVHNEAGGPFDGRRVGVRLQGATLCYDDLLLERGNVRTYTFSEAPSDWLVQRGTWEVTSRWTCSPGWTWLSGLSDRFAAVQSKWEVQGDVLLDTYVGPKMMQTPQGRKEELQDLRLGLCGRPGYLNAGYCFLIGARDGSWTALQRDGLVVAETSDFVVPQGGVHNDWVQFTVRKRGGEVALLCRGQVVLSYTDPDPLPGGSVALGSYNNGLMFPRVTVYGRVQ